MRRASLGFAAISVLASSTHAQRRAPHPSRIEVMQAMQFAEPGVEICARQYGAGHGVVQATVVFRGAGTVESVELTGPAAETPFGTCVRRAIGLCRVQPFVDANFRLSYPFQY